MTNDTAYVFLTCTKENTRYQVLRQVIENLLSHPQFESFNENLIVFDNNSTYADSTKLLNDSFKTVANAETNYGYWGGIDWFVRNHADVLGREYEYMYLIESDQMHYDWHKFDLVEEFLNKNPDIASCRMREFYVNERHLYDKGNHRPDSRRWAWCTLRNLVTGEKVWFKHVDEKNGIYLTNFTTLPPSMNRVSMMRDAFSHLRTLKSFTEVEFWRQCHLRSQNVALIDGGVCHGKLGWGTDVIASNNTDPVKFGRMGYINASKDVCIPSIDDMKVQLHIKDA